MMLFTHQHANDVPARATALGHEQDESRRRDFYKVHCQQLSRSDLPEITGLLIVYKQNSSTPPLVREGMGLLGAASVVSGRLTNVFPLPGKALGGCQPPPHHRTPRGACPSEVANLQPRVAISRKSLISARCP